MIVWGLLLVGISGAFLRFQEQVSGSWIRRSAKNEDDVARAQTIERRIAYGAMAIGLVAVAIGLLLMVAWFVIWEP